MTEVFTTWVDSTDTISLTLYAQCLRLDYSVACLQSHSYCHKWWLHCVFLQSKTVFTCCWSTERHELWTFHTRTHTPVLPPCLSVVTNSLLRTKCLNTRLQWVLSHFFSIFTPLTHQCLAFFCVMYVLHLFFQPPERRWLLAWNKYPPWHPE